MDDPHELRLRGRHDRLHRLAAPQQAVWTGAQARACGFPQTTIDRLVRTGRWRRWFGGSVFTAAGTPETWETRLQAATFRIGADAVVAGRSAARLWDLPGFDDTDAIELVVARGHTPALDGITVRRTIRLEPAEVVAFGSFRTTSVTRTVHDLAAVLDDDQLLLVAAEGYRLGRTDPLRLLASSHARPRLPGNPRLRRVLEQLDDRFRSTRSVAEIIAITVLEELGYRGFRVNVRLRLTSGRRVEVDVLFGDRAVLEIHGRAYHDGVPQRAADAERRTDLESDGYVVAELWADELADRARLRAVVDDLLACAAAAAARGPLRTVSSERTVSS
jgi:very-short-patch-repair endonuclease